GTTITLSTDKETLDYNKEYTFILYLWIDGTIGNNPLDMTNQPYNFDLNCNITGTDKKIDEIATSLDNFTYYLGSDTTSVDTINYYNPADGVYYNISITPIPLQSNEILLTEYKGTSKDVIVPDTYTVGDTTYNVVALSYIYLVDDNQEIDDEDGIFRNNINIESIFLGNNVKFINLDGSELDENKMYYTFYGCKSLVNAPAIPSSVTDMVGTFGGCTSLVNAPEIPSSVTNMTSTFAGCKSLVNAPEIPSSVTNMFSTFVGCTSLVNAPEIPSSVTNMNSTFSGCTSLVNAPEIPSSVTNMAETFAHCTNLTGIVKINSSKVSKAGFIFNNTTKSITVQVPSGSTTYTTINNLTTTNGKPSNVTLTTY
ncbi:MAG: leucine-rich repeat protein, partial [Bacilli bacterium]|nr:leucine-rich repeat protein [Bacilli bacterium]